MPLSQQDALEELYLRFFALYEKEFVSMPLSQQDALEECDY